LIKAANSNENPIRGSGAWLKDQGLRKPRAHLHPQFNREVQKKRKVAGHEEEEETDN
jgi:hypothetical protein